MRIVNGSEPVTVWGGLGFLVSLGALYFFPDIGAATLEGIASAVAAIAPAAFGLWYARRQVTPVAKEQ